MSDPLYEDAVDASTWCASEMKSGNTSFSPSRAMLVLTLLCRVIGILAGIVFAVVVLVDRRVDYFFSTANVPAAPNLVLACAGCVGVLVAVVLFRSRIKMWLEQLPGDREHAWDIACASVPVVVFVVQLVVYYAAGINTGWDAGALADQSIISDVECVTSQAVQSNFSRYPNNLFLFWLFRRLNDLRLAIVPGVGYRAWLAGCSCFAVSCSCFMFMRVTKSLFTLPSRIVAVVMYIALIGLSPWFMIPYSDTFGLLVVSTMLWCFVCNRRISFKWGLLGLLAVVGYSIKPTILFVFAAMVLASLGIRDVSRVKRALPTVALAVVLGCGLGLSVAHVVKESVDFGWDESKQFTVLHFAMMGLNDDTDGAYLQTDVDLSNGASSVEERRAVNLSVIEERLNAYGPLGLAKHEIRKLLTAYNDGTFAWSVEAWGGVEAGHFEFTGRFNQECRDSLAPLSSILRSLLYADGRFYVVFCTIMQTLWLIVLFGVPWSSGAVGRECSGEQGAVVTAACLVAVALLSVFLLVFEVRARYLFPFGGMFVLLACMGYSQLFRRMHNRFEKASFTG